MEGVGSAGLAQLFAQVALAQQTRDPGQRAQMLDAGVVLGGKQREQQVDGLFIHRLEVHRLVQAHEDATHTGQAGQAGMADGEVDVRLEVAAPLAEEIAAFVEDLSDGMPLLFSAQIGDLVVTVRDALVEMQAGKREGKTWRFLPRGTRGRLMARRGDFGKLFLLDGPLSREHVYVSDRCMTRAR